MCCEDFSWVVNGFWIGVRLASSRVVGIFLDFFPFSTCLMVVACVF